MSQKQGIFWDDGGMLERRDHHNIVSAAGCKLQQKEAPLTSIAPNQSECYAPSWVHL